MCRLFSSDGISRTCKRRFRESECLCLFMTGRRNYGHIWSFVCYYGSVQRVLETDSGENAYQGFSNLEIPRNNTSSANWLE